MKFFLKTGIVLCLIIGCLLPAEADPIDYPTDITVAGDGTGNYKTIQEAINSVRDLRTDRVTIHIKKGVYNEKLVVPSWKTSITLIGEQKDSTIITYNDYSGKLVPGGKDAFGKDKLSTFTSYTLLVQGKDFKAENLTIRNTAGRVGQAVAVHVEADRAVFKNCSILGNQDTLYAAVKNTRQYYLNCYIEGTTDFIFGEATAVFQSCTIRNLTNSYITAAATGNDQRFGFVFFDCSLVADNSVTKAYLGRPWRPYAKTVFIRTKLGAHIAEEGWEPWKGDVLFPNKEKTAYYAEYRSSGVGAQSPSRVEWSHQLSQKEAKKYTLENIFRTADSWIPAQ